MAAPAVGLRVVGGSENMAAPAVGLRVVGAQRMRQPQQ